MVFARALLVGFVVVMSASVHAFLADRRFNVYGRLVCDGKPLANTAILFYETDSGGKNDDLCRITMTDKNGSYAAEGREVEPGFSVSALYVYVQHNCKGDRLCAKHILPDNVWDTSHWYAMNLGEFDMAKEEHVACPEYLIEDRDGGFNEVQCRTQFWPL